MTAAFKLKAPPAPLEQDDAEWLCDWARTQRFRGKRLSDYLVMIPNGALLAGDYKHRAMQMARMKKQGFRPGVSDYFLAIKRGTRSGLWLELKRTRGAVESKDQQDFHVDMREDYACATCKGWHQAMLAIQRYLLQP